MRGAVSSSFLSPYLRMRPVRTFLRSYRGTHPLGRSASSLLRCGEHPRGYPDVASGRCTGTLRQRGRERLPGKRGRTRTVPQRGKAVSSERDIRVPEAERGRVPCRNEDDNRFPCGAKLSTAFPSGTTRKPPSHQPGGFPYSRFRRQRLPQCRSPPQPSAHEYAAPDPEPSPPGTRPRGESPWGQRRGRYRRTAP